MTPAERIDALERESAASRKRLDQIENLLLRTVEANNLNAQAIATLTTTVQHLAAKLDQFAVLT